MSNSEKIQCLRMALALYGIVADEMNCELIITTWEEIKKKGSKFSISDSCSIEYRVRKKYKRIEVKAVKSKSQEE